MQTPDRPETGAAGFSVRKLLSAWLKHEIEHNGQAPIDQMIEEYPEPLRSEIFMELICEEINLLKETRKTDIYLENYLNCFPTRVHDVLSLWLKVSPQSLVIKSPQDSIHTTTSSETQRIAQTDQGSCSNMDFTHSEVERYQLLRQIGKGGMGIVYEAYDRKLERRLAIKMVTDSQFSQRHIRELRLLSQLNSNHVVKILDFIRFENNSVGICMEFLAGGDLGNRLKKMAHLFEESIVKEWMRQTCLGMIAVEEKGITHRDLKPSNLLLDEQSNIKVADFGLAKVNDASDLLTQVPGPMGTFLYMPPEQFEDPRSADGRSDIYSFGATFYHILTGEPPFSSGLNQRKTEALRSPKAINLRLSQRTCEILERCLAKSPEDRFQNFKDLLYYLSPLPTDSLSPWERIGATELGEIYEKFQQRLENYVLSIPVTDIQSDQFSFNNGRCIKIVSGDISESDSDAIVTSDDEYLSMGGGVSWAIRRRAGTTLEDQVKAYGRIRAGRAVVTTGGDLKAKYVIHGVTLGIDALPSRDLISDIVRSVFYHADTLNVKTIAFPLLGTGVGGFQKRVSLETMFRTIARIMLQGMTSVLETRIVLFDPQLKNESWYRE